MQGALKMADDASAVAAAAEVPYDEDNIFAKILDGKIPSHKVFESDTVLAILDAFPVCKGHTLVLPKEKGHATIMTMDPELCGKVFQEVAVVANAVKEATAADGVNILQNNGPASGQQVPHVHFHIVPRWEGDGLKFRPPPSAKEMIAADVAGELLASIQSKLG